MVASIEISARRWPRFHFHSLWVVALRDAGARAITLLTESVPTPQETAVGDLGAIGQLPNAGKASQAIISEFRPSIASVDGSEAAGGIPFVAARKAGPITAGA